MAKQLKDILQGVKKSSKKTNDLGGYAPKAGDEKAFAAKHEIEKHEDRAGNGDDVYNATNVKHSQEGEPRHGYKKPHDQKVNEERDSFKCEPSTTNSVAEDARCNMSEAGSWCPIHEYKQCKSSKVLREKPSTEVEEAWVVKHPSGKTTEHPNQKEALRAAREHGLDSKAVSATHGAMGKKAHDVLAPHQKKERGSFGPWGYKPPEGQPKGKKKLREMVDIEEGRGRPRKDAAAKQEDEKEHIVMQLRKSVSLRGQKHVKFDNGETHQVSMDHAKKALAKHDSMHRAADKQSFASKLSKSHSSLQKAINESHDDESAEMAKTQLKALASKAAALEAALSDDQIIEPWVQSKLAVAKQMISDVHDYMIHGDHDNSNEQTGPDSPMTFPNMNVDVAGQSI